MHTYPKDALEVVSKLKGTSQEQRLRSVCDPSACSLNVLGLVLAHRNLKNFRPVD